MGFPYIIDCDSNFPLLQNEFILLAFLKLRKQAPKMLTFIKMETALVRKQQGYFNYLHESCFAKHQSGGKIFQEAIELGLCRWIWIWL
jgi:hypothetical protein